MAFRKFQAETIFDGTRFHHRENVLIVTPSGTIEAIVPAAEAGDDVQQLNGILSPGFVNCHCHLELSHMKGRIPEKTGLVDFVFKVVTERHHPEEEIRQAIADAEDEMIRGGIVAVGDICNNALTIAQKQKHRLHYYNFVEASGWLPGVSDARFDRARQLFDQFKSLNAQRSSGNTSIVPHAPYSVSNELWASIQPYFQNRVASIHNQETAFEDAFFLNGTGDFTRMYQIMNIDNSHHQPTNKTSLQSYFDKLQTAKRVILVHNTFTSEDDIRYIHQQPSVDRQVYFCLCINANRYIEDALPPVEMFRARQCNMVIGTDSLASNWSLGITDELKMLRRHFPGIPLEEMLGWATLNGARALEMDETLGSFEKGKIPGVVFFDENLSFIERLL